MTTSYTTQNFLSATQKLQLTGWHLTYLRPKEPHNAHSIYLTVPEHRRSNSFLYFALMTGSEKESFKKTLKSPHCNSSTNSISHL